MFDKIYLYKHKIPRIATKLDLEPIGDFAECYYLINIHNKNIKNKCPSIYYHHMAIIMNPHSIFYSKNFDNNNIVYY